MPPLAGVGGGGGLFSGIISFSGKTRGGKGSYITAAVESLNPEPLLLLIVICILIACKKYCVGVKDTTTAWMTN